MIDWAAVWRGVAEFRSECWQRDGRYPDLKDEHQKIAQLVEIQLKSAEALQALATQAQELNIGYEGVDIDAVHKDRG